MIFNIHAEIHISLTLKVYNILLPRNVVLYSVGTFVRTEDSEESPVVRLVQLLHLLHDVWQGSDLTSHLQHVHYSCTT